MPNLKTMSVSELLTLRKEVDQALEGRRSELHAQLSQIGGRFDKRSAMKGGNVAAKYRHPKTGDEWSGRGANPKWLAAEIKAGKKEESFLIK